MNTLTRSLNTVINKEFTQKAIAQLSNPKALAPVILLEGTVIAGRCYQAKKRGEWTEFRERLVEETSAAIVWIFGVEWLNQACNFIIKKSSSLFKNCGFEKIDTDLGKDSHRDPFNKIMTLAKKSDKEKKILATVKFSKIVLCSALGIYLIGSVIPRFNQAVTRLSEARKKESENNNKQAEETRNSTSSTSPNNKNVNMNEFLNFTKKQQPAFSGRFQFLDTVRTVAHNFEHNNLCKLLIVDAGLISGRAYHARNKDEKYEILFRDIGSIVFYMFSTPYIAKFLAKVFDKSGKTTNLDPRATKVVHDTLMGMVGDEKVGLDAFKKEIVKKEPALIKDAVEAAIPDLRKDWKFVPHESVKQVEQDIRSYLSAIFDKAKGSKVDKELLIKMQNRNSLMKLGFVGVGLGISALFLSYIIPKVQYFMTEKRTGEKGFPGVKDLK